MGRQNPVGNISTMSDNFLSRRHFFFGTLLAGAVPSAGYGSVASLRALGYKPFYNKLNVAAIGCGGQGGVILNDAAKTEKIVALCDVDAKRGVPNLERYSKAARYEDFRVMLDKEGANIDGVRSEFPISCTPQWLSPACSAASTSTSKSR